MIIECEKCHAKFNLDDNVLKETGSKLRCSRCRHIFTAFPPEQELQIEGPLAEELEEAGELAAEEISKEQELLSDFDKTIAEEIEEEVGQKEEEIEAISFDELSQLDSGVIRKAEEEGLDIDEAMDKAAKVEEEITAQKEAEREEEVEEAEELEEPAKPRPIIKKRGRSKLWITILLVILIIAVGGAALVVFKPDFLPGPFFKKPLSKEQAFDMGDRRLKCKDVDTSFVNSEKAGQLFVVKGLVTNNYPDKRSFIRIRSNILDSKGTVVKTKIVYAGNPISDKELLSLSMEEIDNRLRDKFGKDKMNINVLPNSSIPFMIVYGKLPESAAEVDVTPVSSSPAGK